MNKLLNKFGKHAYHLVINQERNRHFIKELKEIESKAIQPIIPLPIYIQKEIQEYYGYYGYKNVDLRWHRYIYSQTGKINKLYIPENFYHIEVEPRYTKLRTDWEDKAYMNRILSDVRFPECVIRNVNGYFIDNNEQIICLTDALNLVKAEDKVIIKPTIASGGGRSVVLKSGNEINEGLFEKYGKNFIVQKKIEQNGEYAVFNESSVNTEKIISFLYQGEVFILTSILRVGAPGAITDTASTGKGYTVGIKDNGQLNEIGYSIFGEKKYEDASGRALKKCRLKYHNQIVDIIKEAHKKLLYFGIISWDFTVDKNGNPILIEYNLNYPEVMIYQMNNGPLFGELTDLVLEDIAACRRLEKR